MIKVLIGIIMLCIIVVSHELGHMLIAKASHIEVKEFWIGFGPKLLGFEKGGTKYCLRLIPLGGACVFEDPEELENSDNSDNSENQELSEVSSVENETPHEENSELSKTKKFNEASVWARIATLFAGPLFNFILAFLLGLVVFANSYMPSTKVVDVTEGSPAQEAGIMAGDTIVKINSSRVYLFPEVSMAIQMGIGKPLEVTYRRDNHDYSTQLIPVMNEEYGYYMIGVSFGGEDEAASRGPVDIIKGSYQYVRYMVKMSYMSFGMLFNGQASVRDMSGAVGIVSVVSDEYDAAAAVSPLAVLVSMLNIAVLISANLGVVNLLPFPALDGGRLLFAFYEVVSGKKPNQKVEGIINLIGMALLLLLLIFTMFNDVLRLIGR